MRILFVVPYVPSLVRVRPLHLIRGLSARGHRVTVATIWTNDRERDELDALSRHCHDVIAVRLPAWRSLANCGRALPGADPLQSRYSWSTALMDRLNAVRDDHDVAHVEHLRGAEYGLAPDGLTTTMPTVWDSVDCISDLFEQAIQHRPDRVGRLINRIELARTRAYEARAVRRFDRVLVTSARDRASLLALASDRLPDDRVVVLANGVDLDYFTPTDDRREPDTLVFSGKLSYHANAAAVRFLLDDIMPRIWTARPGVKLWLVGKDPSRELRALAARWPASVEITGTVPDVRPYLRRAAVAVTPLVYGVGCQNKVLEAMACGTPVVSTSRAVGALGTGAGREVVVADGAGPFADAVLSLLASDEARQQIGRAGRAYVETHHQWDRIAARLEGVYADVLSSRRRHLERIAG